LTILRQWFAASLRRRIIIIVVAGFYDLERKPITWLSIP